MSSCSHRRELGKHQEEEDEDKLLATLSSEELRELERELAELDDADDVPVGMRQPDQTAKTPTGTFDRGALLRYWEDENKKLLEEAVVEPDFRQQAQDGQRQPGKSRAKHVTASDYDGPEHNDGLKKNTLQKRKKGESVFVKTAQASNKEEEEKKDLCKKEAPPKCSEKKLGNALSKGSDNEPGKNAFCDHLRSQSSDRPSGNPIVIDHALEQILQNDAGTNEINLNNIEDISQETLLRFAEALGANTHVRVFSLANTRADDRVAFAISKMLRENGSIRNLNIESNFVSGQGILALLTSLQHNCTLEELRFHNQRHICGGKVEMEIVRLLRENRTLLKLGYQFDLPGPRMTATSILTRNQDQQRQRRLQQQKEVCLPEAPAAVNPSGHVSGSSVANRPAKKLTKNNNNPPPPPPPTAKLPAEKIAELVKQREGYNGTKGQPSQKKSKSKKVKNGVNEKESADILQELQSSLKPSLQKTGDGSYWLPQRPTRDDLMEAIRGSSIRSLKRVSVSESRRNHRWQK